MSYTQVFGGTTLYPSDVSYLAVALSANITLEWPLESAAPTYPAARIIDVTAAGAYNIDLPDARRVGSGQAILFNNLSGSASACYIRDAAGTTIATLGIGEQWQVYLASNTTGAGTWRVYRFGASTASVQPSSLAGYGIAVTAGALSQSVPVTTFTSSPRTLLATERAAALVWEGTGSGTINLLAAATVGSNFFFSVRNAGGGDVTLDASGSETINGATTLVLRPGDSATLLTDGLEWFTLGLGQEAVFAFDYTSIDLTSETSPYTLSGAELNRIAYKFIGTLTANMQIIVPPTVQQYWVDNQTTGSFTLTIKTASGSGSSVTQGGRGIYYCDGSSVVNASTAGISVPLLPSEGGTGQTVYATGDLLYASGAATLSRLADVATGNALLAGGVGTAPLWGKIGLTTHVSGTLPIANGGTGATTDSGARTALGLGTIATQSAASVSITGGSITGITDLAVADGGTGASTASVARTNLGATTVGANVFTLTNPSAITFPRFNADNTVSALDAASFRTAIGVGTGTGSVTSVGGTGTVNGITLTGTVTTSGNLTLGGTLSGVSLTTQVTGTLPIANGGTGATTDSGARTALGLGSLATLSTINNSNWSGTVLSVANGGTGASDAGTARTNLGLGTIATQAASAVSITGGSITGITDLAIADGGTGASDAGTARTNLGLGTIATQASSSVSITGGSITGITDLAVADGGTGASTAANARVNLLPSYTSNQSKVLALNSGATDVEWVAVGIGSVTSVAASGGTTGLTFSGSPITSSGTLTLSGTLAIANGGTGATTDSGARTALGLGTIATQSAASVSITGGSITGITDLAIADGGTGASDAGTARTNLGLGSLATQSSINDSNWSGSDLTIANGGTGASDAATARSNLGAAASGANTDITALDQDVTVTATGTIAAESIGYRGLPQNSQTSSYTLVLADAGKHISITTGGVVIPANSGTAFPVGTTIALFNNSGSTQTVSITTDTLRQAGTTNTGSRTLAVYGLATCIKVASTTWVISGSVS